jgi:phenylpyruvate tautomerase PptA (4-oxalocrotonate tautomerase family)
MPLVRIALRSGKSPEYRKAIGDAVHQSMVKEINVPAKDRFQVITEHDTASLIYDADYLGIHRTDDVVFIQITLSEWRSVELKKKLFEAIVEALAASPGIRREDVFINLVEVVKENWSFGNGIAQYAT